MSEENQMPNSGNGNGGGTTLQPVATNEAEKILEGAVLVAFNKVMPGQFLDPVMIITLIGTILEAIRGCRSGEAAASHIKRGSVISHRAVVRKLLAEGYKRPIANQMAHELVTQGKSLQDKELSVLVNEAKDAGPVQMDIWPA